MSKLIFLCPFIGIAGFIDSIAGGGGIISLTAYVASGLSGIVSLATNKFSAFIGSSAACANYIRTGNFDFKALVPSVIASVIGSNIGARIALIMNNRIFSIVMLIITPVLAFINLLDKNYAGHEKDMSNVKRGLICFVISFAVGLYDGFYGPGTGTFMQMGFIFFAGINIRKACGNARITNWGSNLGAIIPFIISGNVIYSYGIPCAICSIIGNYLGSKFAIKHDAKVIKPVMLIVVFLLFLKVLLDFIR